MAKKTVKHEPQALSILAVGNEEDAPMTAARFWEGFALLPYITSEMGQKSLENASASRARFKKTESLVCYVSPICQDRGPDLS